MKVFFKPKPKQQIFMDAVFSGKYIFLFFGGSAGGGKTYVGLATLILLSKIFTGSKWCVIRKDRTKLNETTIPTFYKIVPPRFMAKPKVIKGIANFTNGSQIIFRGENFAYDKDLGWMDGFECNGFLIEEGQEIQLKTFEKSNLRAGRHIIKDTEDQPPKIIIVTGNPSQNWTKKKFVIPFREGTLQAPYYYLQSLMSDNDELSKSYLDSLSTLDSNTYKRFVLGDWDVIEVDKPFAYAFRPFPKTLENGKVLKPHIGILKPPIKSLPVYLSFDFNVDPITCLVIQSNGKDWIRVHKEYRMQNSDIYKLCDVIKRDFKGYYLYVTGDPAGLARQAISRDNLNYYTVIKNELGLKLEQLRVPKSHQLTSNSRVLMNAMLERFPSIIFDADGCPFTISDLMYCEVKDGGTIDKSSDKHKTHLLDCWKYYLDTFWKRFVTYKL